MSFVEDTSGKGLVKGMQLAKKMNNGLISGAAYRGRVLISMKSSLYPDAKVFYSIQFLFVDIFLQLGKDKINGCQLPPTQQYFFRVDLFEAAELPTKKDVSIDVCIGPYKVSSSKASVKVRFN
jgi:hypothetical protein